MKTRFLTSIFTFSFIFLSPGIGNSQNFNRPVPDPFPKYEFQRSSSIPTDHYFLFTPHWSDGPSGIAKSIYLTDADGYIVWMTATDRNPVDFNYHPSLGLYVFATRKYAQHWHFMLDQNFNLVDSISVPSIYGGDVHEFTSLPNGHMMVLGMEWNNMDLSSYTFYGSPGDPNTNVNIPHVIEFDTSHNVVWDWRAIDHLPVDMYVEGYPYNLGDFDYLHPNSIEQDYDGNVLVSFRHADAIVKIDHSTDSVMWIMGGNYNQFTFPNDSGFYGQHDARMISANEMSLFDNQKDQALDSRGAIYQIDTSAMTATLTHEYHDPGVQYSKTQGSYRVLGNGYEVLGWGGCYRPGPSISLVDQFGSLAASFHFADTVASYRAYYETVPTLPNRPTVTCMDVPGGIELTCSASSYYLWSTGESTQQITVTDTGTYQVWVEQGIGLLSSEPLHITDIGTFCATIGIEEETYTGDEFIIGYFDLLGKQLQEEPVNKVYLIRYNTGRIEKRFRCEY